MPHPFDTPSQSFDAWARELVAALRGMVPDVAASRRGRDVVLRRGAVEAVLRDRGAYVELWIGDRVAFTPERVRSTAVVCARSLAGSFDVDRFTK